MTNNPAYEQAQDHVNGYCMQMMQQYGTDSTIGKRYSNWYHKTTERQHQLEIDVYPEYATLEDFINNAGE